jgi:uncharacterized protein YjcR
MDHDKAMELYFQGANDLKIAQVFDCSVDYIGNWRRRNKLPAYGRKKRCV